MATKYERSWELDSTLEIHESWIPLWLFKVNNLNQKLVHLFSSGRSNVARKVSFVFDVLFTTKILLVFEQWYRSHTVAVSLQHLGLEMTLIIFQQGWLMVVVCCTTARTATRAELVSTFRGEALGFLCCSWIQLEIEQLTSGNWIDSESTWGASYYALDYAEWAVVAGAVSRRGRRCTSHSPTSWKLAAGSAFFRVLCDFEFVSGFEASNQLTFV